jgi:hypothetical protein
LVLVAAVTIAVLAAPGSALADCRGDIGSFVNALSEIDSRLDIGLSFVAYSEKVADAKVEYDKIEWPDVGLACVRQVGVFAEQAFNRYAKAYRIWNSCIESPTCTNAKIKRKLQAQWAQATKLIRRAKRGFARA